MKFQSLFLRTEFKTPNCDEGRCKRWVFRVWCWPWLWDDTWRLTSTHMRERVRYIQGCGSNSSCASGCRSWYSLSQTARQSSMSLFHRRRLCCQDAFIVTGAPALKLKPAKWGVGGVLVGKMLHSDSLEEDGMLKAAVKTVIHNSWGDAVVAEQQELAYRIMLQPVGTLHNAVMWQSQCASATGHFRSACQSVVLMVGAEKGGGCYLLAHV